LKLKGAQAVVLMHRQHSDRLIAARIGNAGGVTVGVGRGEMFIASDLPAILEHTRRMVFLQSRQMAVVLCDGLKMMELDSGERAELPVNTIPYDPVSAAKGNYTH
jgi:glucosamine--fructose-6-phosphate aminotransferase (isomerizing)